MSSPTTSLNIPRYKGILTLISRGLLSVSSTVRHLPALTRHPPAHRAVIEENVEGFFEDF
jgi:hypothetical protein